MARTKLGSIRVAAGAIAAAVIVTAGGSFLAACGGGSGGDTGGGVTDVRFAPQTSDEYTQPTERVVVGMPTGVVRGGTLMPDGQIVGGVLESSSLQSKLANANTADSVTPPVRGGSSSSGGPVSGAGSSGSSGAGPTSSGGSSGVGMSDAGTGPSSSGGTFDGGPSVSGEGSGQWHFDDCSPTSNFLTDATGMGANAQHALGAACVPGIAGLGVQFRTPKDVVQVPDEPQFTINSTVAAAAWVHPTTVTGNQPIVVKRLNKDTAFSLGIHNGNIEMSVVLASGTTVISRAPISPGVWTHVAGMYDGTFVFLFINGQQFGQVFGGGALHNVFAPLRIGATSQTQLFNGIIDEVFVSTLPISKDTLTALACVPRPTTVSVNPTTSGLVPPDTTVHYDLTVTDNDVGFCNSFKEFEVFQESFETGINVSLNSFFVVATPGSPGTVGIDVTGTEDADPGDHTVVIVLDNFFNFPFEFLQANLDYDLGQPTGCFVATKRELMITSTAVVDDPVRTAGNMAPGFFFGGGSDGGGVIIGGSGGVAGGSSGGGGPIPVPPPGSGGSAGGSTGVGPVDASVPVPTDAGTAPASSQGVWSFGYLMRQMAPTPEQAPAMVLQLLQLFLSNQTVNGFTVAAKPLMQQDLIDVWPKLPNGDLDLDNAPMTLDAIVNRIDVRDLSTGSAGEGRFVFGVDGPAFNNFNIIIEYNLPAQTQDDVQNWANRWHALSSHPFPSEEYNAALEAITRGFTDRGAMPSAVNGSALNEFRTNEFALSGFSEWELRGFVLSPATGFFAETTVKETPDISFNGTQALADFTNQNGDAIKAEIPGANDNTVPATFEGQNFLGGSALNPFFAWNAFGIVDPDARFHMSANTCNGCHGPDTGTPNFQMVLARSLGQESPLSPFLTGVTVRDQFSGQIRTLNDLGRRRADLTSLVCGTDGGVTTEAGTPPPPPPAFDAAGPTMGD